MMAFPIVNSALELLDGLLVFGATLSLIDFVCNSFRGGRTRLELLVVRIILRF
jgi:hypothetical protein